MKLQVLAVGGTIDKVYFDALSEYHIGAPAALEILQRVKANFDYDVTQMISKDSLDMTELRISCNYNTNQTLKS